MCHKRYATSYSCGHPLPDPSNPRYRQFVRCRKFKDVSERDIPRSHLTPDTYTSAPGYCADCEDVAIANARAAGHIKSDAEVSRQREHTVRPSTDNDSVRRLEQQLAASSSTSAAPAPAPVPYPAGTTPSGYGPPPQPAQPYFIPGNLRGLDTTTIIVDGSRLPARPMEPPTNTTMNTMSGYGTQYPASRGGAGYDPLHLPTPRPSNAVLPTGASGPGNPLNAARLNVIDGGARNVGYYDNGNGGGDVVMRDDDDYDLYREPTPEPQVSTNANVPAVNTNTYSNYPATMPPEIRRYRAQIDALQMQQDERRAREAAEGHGASRGGHGDSRSGHGESRSGRGESSRSGQGHSSGRPSGSGAGKSSGSGSGSKRRGGN